MRAEVSGPQRFSWERLRPLVSGGHLDVSLTRARPGVREDDDEAVAEHMSMRGTAVLSTQLLESSPQPQQVLVIRMSNGAAAVVNAGIGRAVDAERHWLALIALTPHGVTGGVRPWELEPMRRSTRQRLLGPIANMVRVSDGQYVCAAAKGVSYGLTAAAFRGGPDKRGSPRTLLECRLLVARDEVITEALP